MRRDVRGTRRFRSGPPPAPAAGNGPAGIHNVTGWYRADTVVGSPVSQWTDLSGFNRHFTQGTGGLQPAITVSVASLNNQPAVTFDGVDDVLDGPAYGTLVSAGAAVILIVGQYITDGGGICLVSATVPATAWVEAIRKPVAGTSASLDWGTTSGVIATPGVALATAAGKFEMRHVSGTLYHKVGATEVSAACDNTIASVLGATTRMGVSRILAYANCHLAEVVFCNADLSASDRTAWDSYVLSRYGI